jgi:translocation and assembly module TamA
MQLVVAGKWIWPLPRSSRLLVSASAGRLWYDVFEDLPPSVRFFAGGDNSVRGYRYQTLGPINELGEVIGGSRLLTGSVEIEKQLKPAWSVALFADTGNAFASSTPDLHSSIGIGARWQSPLGPVRFDIAEPLDGIDRNTQIHITLGPDL